MNKTGNKRNGRAVLAGLGFLVWLAAPTSALMGKTRYVSVAPVKGTPVAVVTDENISSFFLCSQREPLEFDVTGPGTVEITTRLLLPKGKTEGSYAVELREGGRLLERHETQSELAMAKLSGRPERVCKSRKFHHEISPGAHHLTLVFTGGNFLGVAANLGITTQFKPDAFVAITPLSYARSTVLLANEKQMTYYVAAPDRPVVFRVVGPARLKVVSRLVFDERMQGLQKYAVSVFEGKKLWQRFPLQTTKSTAQSFRDWPEVVPGKSRTFYIDAPSGEHQYNFGLSEGVGRGVALLFALPKSSLSNE